MSSKTSLSRLGILATGFLLLSQTVQADTVKKKPAPAKKENPALEPITDVEGLPRVLLIGDSISIGYTVPVREKMEGIANIHRPLANCGPTILGLERLSEWLATGGADKKWDIIHFNWGLHDLKFMSPDGGNLADPADPVNHRQVSPEDYKANLTKLVAQLKETGAKLILRNTTPSPVGAQGRLVEDVPVYNAIAAEVMTEAGIPTHDLYTYVLESKEPLQLEANVHFSPEGSDALADDVVRILKEALAQ